MPKYRVGTEPQTNGRPWPKLIAMELDYAPHNASFRYS